MEFLSTGNGGSRTLILAHGAGAPMDSPFMTTIAELLADRGVNVLRFEFPYMAQRRRSGRRPGPDRAPVLLQSWRDAVAVVGDPASIYIGGKSLGGRIASMVADELAVRGLLCLGYPFQPPGQPQKLRTEHLVELQTKTLILQGERDPFGGRDEIASFHLSHQIAVEFLTDGDHSFKPRQRSGHTEAGNLQRAADAAAGFMLAMERP